MTLLLSFLLKGWKLPRCPVSFAEREFRDSFLYFLFTTCTVVANEILGVDIRVAYIAGIVTVRYLGSFMVGPYSHPNSSPQWQPATTMSTTAAADLESPLTESSIPLLTDGTSRAPERALKTSLTESRLATKASNSTLPDVQVPKRELLPGMKARPFQDAFSHRI